MLKRLPRSLPASNGLGSFCGETWTRYLGLLAAQKVDASDPAIIEVLYPKRSARLAEERIQAGRLVSGGYRQLLLLPEQ